MIETNVIVGKKEKITASSVNIIQTGLNQISTIWNIPSQGEKLAVVGEKCQASLINNWISWLKIYANRIGASSITNTIGNIKPGEPMLYSKIKSLYDDTQRVKNWCNRSECNRSECNSAGESNGGESNNNECW